MSQHYFDPDPRSESREKTITFEYRGHTCRCVTDAGTFSKGGLDQGTFYMLDTVEALPPCRVLDLGCGWGPVTVALGTAFQGSTFTCVDVNARALALAGRNAADCGINALTVLSDGFEALGEERFDCIFLNPPIRAGKQTVYRLFEGAAAHLDSGGRLWVVIRRQQGAESALKELNALFGAVDVILKKKGYWVIVCQDPVNKGDERG